ncbi:MAG: hypothetical protein EXS05_04410 [Planctomycetaceae bacterium]|nr:hypothetical protein [Planctomycetaceae bacterium]
MRRVIYHVKRSLKVSCDRSPGISPGFLRSLGRNSRGGTG